MELDLRGYNTTVNHKEVSAEMAVEVAAGALRLGHVTRVLVGGVEALSEPLHHGYRRLGALSRSGSPRPYRAQRDGLCLGEGAAVVALECREHALARGATVLAELVGVGAAGGPRPLAGWGPAWEAGRALGPSPEAGVVAVQAALEEASIRPAEVSLVVGCGCGSRDLDQLDAEVLRSALDGASPWVTSPHGTIGTFPAAGALRLVSAVEALRRGCVYPTCGHGELDPAAVPGLLAETRHEQRLDSVLLVSHASGGASAALVLKRGES
jgi:3-oxoacyl-[acyl-carrier-protein] synthase II